MGLRSTYRRCRFWQKKNLLSRWSAFWSWRVCKQVKLSHLWHRKSAGKCWKADAPNASHSLARILVYRHNWAIFLWKWARRGHYSQWRTLSGHVERFYFFTKIEEEDIGNIWFQQDGAMCHTAEITFDVLRPVPEDRIISHGQLMSFCHLGAVIWHCWTIICRMPSRISVTLTSQRQLTL